MASKFAHFLGKCDRSVPGVLSASRSALAYDVRTPWERGCMAIIACVSPDYCGGAMGVTICPVPSPVVKTKRAK